MYALAVVVGQPPAVHLELPLLLIADLLELVHQVATVIRLDHFLPHRLPSLLPCVVLDPSELGVALEPAIPTAVNLDRAEVHHAAVMP